MWKIIVDKTKRKDRCDDTFMELKGRARMDIAHKMNIGPPLYAAAIKVPE